ncbi:DUF6049 family protein [Bifidobacterium felsineum]|uniref:Uncharacterized protein n=1 Tax=Bifidobacterium felsineum TaxID=2045440 RepID=A0A2M9HL68_9BIFI|nr:DUF6049 family protein [Bifidobacterium felsineum]MBT1163029.1 hypothetical protein [Bifidobacterium felsineum]PJM77543.1 hypothetical protein CSQ86_00075 [Bifidobacterium felsineum]
MIFAPVAWADDSNSANDSGSTQTQQAKSSQSNSGKSAETLTIAQSTPIVTASSGFHLQVIVTNNSDADTPAGTLMAATNALFTFASRSDMQSWAENGTNIPTPNPLGSVDVPAITAGNSTTVTLDVTADQQALAAIRNWGPKPLTIAYVAGNTRSVMHSFLTRSSDGLSTAQTPAMNLTVAMPLTSGDWQTNETAITNLIEETDSAGSSSQASGKAQESTQSNGNTNTENEENENNEPLLLSAEGIAQTKALEQTVAKHPRLQIVADPLYLQESGSKPTVAGIMQPADFDITSYAAINNASAYTNAGVTDAQWTAENARTIYTAANKTTETPSAYAWQGSADWTIDALTKARAQGYSTVIASASFDNEQTDTVHTGTYVVNTTAGDVTVLKEQSELGTLAHGRATSKEATAETSDAGRLARLMAQSAFYQMEQPYTTRNLLVTFTRANSSAWIDQVMSALEQASWLNLTDLSTMANTDPYHVSDSVNQSADTPDTSATQTMLNQLTASRQGVLRLANSILKDHGTESKQWLANLLTVHDGMALRALTGAGPSDSHQRMAQAAQSMSDTLLGSVSITPSEPVSVFSESAKMPITVSNKLPYAVSVKVNSITNSMQIVTSRTNDVVIPAHSEAQVAFTIRVSTSGSAIAHVSLADRQSVAFGNTQDTTITSVLRISDASGFIIIGFAVLLGLVGLWRQFNRKKDPDE